MSSIASGNISKNVTLLGQSGYPDAQHPATLTYAIVTQPAHGTIQQFNPSTGTLVYQPSPGYHGPDSFQYKVQSTGPQSSPASLESNVATVTITVASKVVADYDGDGKTDFGFYNPNTATFVDVPSGGGKPIILTGFGGPGWQATSGDYDGDGKTDIGLYNAAAGTFVEIPSGGGKTIVISNFGGTGAQPLGVSPAPGGTVKATDILRGQATVTSATSGVARATVAVPSLDLGRRALTLRVRPTSSDVSGGRPRSPGSVARRFVASHHGQRLNLA